MRGMVAGKRRRIMVREELQGRAAFAYIMAIVGNSNRGGFVVRRPTRACGLVCMHTRMIAATANINVLPVVY